MMKVVALGPKFAKKKVSAYLSRGWGQRVIGVTSHKGC